MISTVIVASVATLPAYYALYALYADYLVNNSAHRAREYFERLGDLVKYIQPMIGPQPAYMKSWSLRLFTERSALERFSPERAATAWWLVRQAVDEIGPPRRWPYAPRSVRSWRRPVRRAPPPAAPEPPARPALRYPRSPIDYRMAV